MYISKRKRQAMQQKAAKYVAMMTTCGIPTDRSWIDVCEVVGEWMADRRRRGDS